MHSYHAGAGLQMEQRGGRDGVRRPSDKPRSARPSSATSRPAGGAQHAADRHLRPASAAGSPVGGRRTMKGASAAAAAAAAEGLVNVTCTEPLTGDKGPLRRPSDISHQHDLTPSVRSRERSPSSRADAFVVDEPAFKPVEEPVYTAEGLLAQLGTRQSLASELPDSEIPTRFHLFTHAPFRPEGYRFRPSASADACGADVKAGVNPALWDRAVFPSKSPSSRWEVVQLARVFELMMDEANRATTGLPPTASAEELVARDARPALKSLWEVYHVIHLEIVRQVWVHCTERGALLERVREGMEMTMLYARQMLGAYREALAEALQEVARQHAQPEAVRAALAELQEERRVSEKLRDHVKLLELRVLEVEKEKEELIVDLVAVKQTVAKAEGDRQMHEKAEAMAEFVLKKNQASMETMYNETLQAKEHARSALGAMHALTDRNKRLEEENLKLPGLTETCVSLGNLTRVLMWSAHEGDPAVLLKCAGEAAATLAAMGGDALTRGLARCTSHVGAAMLASSDASVALPAMALLLETERPTAAGHLVSLADSHGDEWRQLSKELVKSSLDALCYSIKTLPRSEMQRLSHACDADVRENILSRLGELFPRRGEAPPEMPDAAAVALGVAAAAGAPVVGSSAAAGVPPSSPPASARPPTAPPTAPPSPGPGSVIGGASVSGTPTQTRRMSGTQYDGASVLSRAISQTEGSRAASQLGGKTVDLDGGMTSASGARARLYSKPVCLDVTVAVRSGSTAVHVHDGREELVLSSPVASHLALVQLDRASLEVTFDDVYPLDCGLAATRLRRDLDLAGADDLLVVTCFEWDRTYKQRLLPVAEYLANHGDTTLTETLNDVSGHPSPSFAAVICPGEPNMLSEPDAWTGTLAYNPVSKQYDPVHASRMLTVPGLASASVLGALRCAEHSTRDELVAVQGILGAALPSLKRVFQHYCLVPEPNGPSDTPFTISQKQWDVFTKDCKLKIKGAVNKVFAETLPSAKCKAVPGELEFTGFLQAVVRLALMTCSKPPAKGEEGKAKKPQGPPGPPSVCQGLVLLLQKHVLQSCKRLEGMTVAFCDELTKPALRTYIAQEEMLLRKCFSAFSSGLPSIPMAMWLMFCKRLSLKWVSASKLRAIFVGFIDPRAKATAMNWDTDTEMNFNVFSLALAKVAQEEFAKERSVEETAMAELLPMFVERYLVPNESRILAPRTEPKEPKKAPAKKR